MQYCGSTGTWSAIVGWGTCQIFQMIQASCLVSSAPYTSRLLEAVVGVAADDNINVAHQLGKPYIQRETGMRRNYDQGRASPLIVAATVNTSGGYGTALERLLISSIADISEATPIDSNAPCHRCRARDHSGEPFFADSLSYHDLRTVRNAAVKIDDVLIHHADAS
jgi:hypothetical protein